MNALAIEIAANIGESRLIPPEDVAGRALDPMGRRAPPT